MGTAIIILSAGLSGVLLVATIIGGLLVAEGRMSIPGTHAHQVAKANLRVALKEAERQELLLQQQIEAMLNNPMAHKQLLQKVEQA